MSHLPTLLPLGDSAWTVEFGDRIDPALHARVMGLNVALHVARDAGDLAGIVDLVPTFRSLTVHYDPLAVDGQLLGTRLLQMAEGYGESSHSRRVLQLPQEQLALMLAISRQTTNQILKELQAQGIVQLAYGEIEILDLQRLQQAAQA